MITIPNIEDKTALEIQDILTTEKLSMVMGYRKGKYECALYPNYHATTNVILGHADTYIGAMDAAFKKVGDIAV